MGALLLSLSPAGAQRLGDVTFKVNCDKGNQTIQAAVDKASGGTTILVSGACTENVSLAKHGLRLVSTPGASITAANNGSSTVVVLGRNVRVTDLAISGGSTGVSVSRGASVRILDSVIQMRGATV